MKPHASDADDPPFLLDDDPLPAAEAAVPAWKILVVDDDPEVHEVTRLNLRLVRFRDRRLTLIHALSANAARALLAEHSDIALALIDVVMETEHSGLDLIRHIRTDLRNLPIRLVLRTGQPGQAPQESVIIAFEIDGYAAKTELTATKLIATVITALRGYEALHALATLNAELESRVAARTAELEKLAMIDALTGLANRRHFEARAAIEVAEARRGGQPLALLALDIDHFKRINDTYGHAVGDLALRQVAQIVSRTVRPGDLVCRIGGEEFVALLPQTDPVEAATIAERVRAALQAAALQAGDVSLAVTTSIGVAQLASEDRIDPVLARADAALYRAKNAGRNLVMAG